MASAHSAVEGAGHPVSASSATGREPQGMVHSISLVVPVFMGEKTLGPLVAEIEPLTQTRRTPQGNLFRVAEMILVHDCGPDNSDVVMEQLAAQYPFVKLVWLARNFGQHPATLAGAANSTSDWVVTMDEDGDHDPGDLGRFLDCALETDSQLVYARPIDPPSHGFVRNILSAVTKRVLVMLLVSNNAVVGFHSYRLIDGEIARSLAAYCGHNVYLDAALSWVIARSAHCPTRLRTARRPQSGYNYRRLASHFWRLVLTSGTKPLRVISVMGLSSILLGAVISVWALWARITGQVAVPGWASTTILLGFFSGGVLFSLGVIAEYLGVTLSMAMGKPLYLVVSKPPRKRASIP